MKITLRAFGIAKDILGKTHLEMEVEPPCSVQQVKGKLVGQFPAFKDLASLAIAVNAEYVLDDFLLKEDDEVVIIPPVSGG